MSYVTQEDIEQAKQMDLLTTHILNRSHQVRLMAAMRTILKARWLRYSQRL